MDTHLKEGSHCAQEHQSSVFIYGHGVVPRNNCKNIVRHEAHLAKNEKYIVQIEPSRRIVSKFAHLTIPS